MRGKFILPAGVFLAACVLAVHFWKPAVVAPPQTAVIQPIYFQPKIHSPTKPALPEKANPAAPSARAIAAAETNPPAAPPQKSETRGELMSRLRAWAAKDPGGALAYALKMPAGYERNDALQAVCLGLAEKDPTDALELAQTLQQPEALMENLVQQWAASDLPSALVWVHNQPASDERDQFYQRVAFVLSQNDPADAAGLVMEQIPPGPAQDEAAMTVLHQWGIQNLRAAALWVQTFPAGPLQERAVNELEGIEQYQEALARQ